MREAQERGNWHMETNLRVGDTSVYWLLDGDATAARKSVEDAMQSWPKGQYLVQDLFALIALTRIDLYDGRGEAALERIDQSWAAARGSFLLRLDFARANLLHARACASLARFRARGEAKDVALATRDARRLGRVRAPWAQALSAQAGPRWGARLRAAARRSAHVPAPVRGALRRGGHGAPFSRLEKAARTAARSPIRPRWATP